MSDEKLTERKLEEAGISYSLIDGEKYFSTREVRSVFPNMKFNVDNIRESDIGRCVKTIDIEPMTDFDMNIRKFKGKR